MSRQGTPQSSFDRTRTRAAISRLATENAPANRISPTATNLALNPRTVLVKVDSVMDTRGVSADKIFEMADGDGLQWVWNVAVNPKSKIRDLRFWAREVIAPEMTRGLSLEQVIAFILGDRKIFHAGDVCQLLRVRRPTLRSLRKMLGGKLQSRGGALFPRAGLFEFLKLRWIGA
jgi:hypothetical protein